MLKRFCNYCGKIVDSNVQNATYSTYLGEDICKDCTKKIENFKKSIKREQVKI